MDDWEAGALAGGVEGNFQLVPGLRNLNSRYAFQRMLDRGLLETMRDAALREDWPGVGDCYLELSIRAQETRERFVVDVWEPEIRLRDPERIASIVDQLLAETEPCEG